MEAGLAGTSPRIWVVQQSLRMKILSLNSCMCTCVCITVNGNLSRRTKLVDGLKIQAWPTCRTATIGIDNFVFILFGGRASIISTCFLGHIILGTDL